jgi:prolyl oligopeptidase
MIWGVLLTTMLVSAGANSPDRPMDALDKLFKDYWEYTLRRSPTFATYLGDHRYGDLLEDLSDQAQKAHIARLREFRDHCRSVETKALPDSIQLQALLFDRVLTDAIDGARFRWHLMPINQQGGPPIDFPQIIESQPFDSVERCEAYVRRLRAFPTQADQLIDVMRLGMKEKIVPFRGSIELCVPQTRALIFEDPAQHPMAKIESKLGASIPAAEKTRILGEVRTALAEAVIPAYRKLADFLEKEYLPACRAKPSVASLPDGAERYAYGIRTQTTTNLDAAKIHQIGLDEMKRIHGEMEGIRQATGFAGDLRAYFEHLRTDPRYVPESKAWLLAEYRKLLEKTDEKLPLLFGKLPKARWDLKEIEEYRAEAAPAAYYYSPPDDGSRPGYFYVNTYQLETRPVYTMPALAFHEAVPGHHLQIALQQEREGIPDFLRHEGFTAYVEGWALYSESLPREVGVATDPLSEFGRLTFEAWRAARLVVDTGIHSMDWTREQAIEYMTVNTALRPHDIESEVDRYIAWPAQALAYKLGELKIRELRRFAEESRGDAFDIREFHDFILGSGALPLDMLDSRVKARYSAASADRKSR